MTLITLGLRAYLARTQAVRRAMICRGWTEKRKLNLLYRLARETESKEGDILEIGSAWGRSTVLLGHASHKRIWSIDPHTGGKAYVDRGELQDSYSAFLENLGANGLLERIRVLKHTTEEVVAGRMIPDGCMFSLVFIDGMHTPEAVELDFSMSYERVSAGGVVIFDDYFQESIADYSASIDKITGRAGARLVKNRRTGLVYLYKT